MESNTLYGVGQLGAYVGEITQPMPLVHAPPPRGPAFTGRDRVLSDRAIGPTYDVDLYDLGDDERPIIRASRARRAFVRLFGVIVVGLVGYGLVSFTVQNDDARQAVISWGTFDLVP
ncbi:MAG TPA: hypothetical protein VGM56_20020 [Byssovorax sp.]|jgi:hypothetical protein